MKRDYHKARKERLPLIRALEPLGLPLDWIAGVVGCDEVTLRKDLASIGIKRSRKTDRAKVFRAVIKRYAELKTRLSREEPGVAGSSGGFDPKLVLFHLGKWLQVEELTPFIRGLEMAMGKLAIPGYPADLEPEAALIHAVFGKSRTPEANGGRRPGQTLDKYFAGISAGNILPPSSHDELLHDLTDRCVNERRREIMPVWPDNVRAVVTRVIDTLTERQAKIIRLRFGIDAEKSLTLEEIGKREDFQVTRDRIRQIEAKALHRLCHPSRSNCLKLLLEPCTVEIHAPPPVNAAPVAPPAPVELDRLDHLVKSVDELETSVRTANCLQNGKIRWVWELTERTEWEMLKIRHFGRKCLKELKDILFEMGGLTFGMKYSEGFRQLLIERTYGRGKPPTPVSP